MNSGCWPKQKPGKQSADKRGRANANLRQLVKDPSNQCGTPSATGNEPLAGPAAKQPDRFKALRETVTAFLRLRGCSESLPETDEGLSSDLKSLLKDLERPTKQAAARTRVLRSLQNRLNVPEAIRWLDAVGTVRGQEAEAAVQFSLLGMAQLRE